MMTIELAKELIRERLNTKNEQSCWLNEFYNHGDNAFFCHAKRIALLPNPVGEFTRPVFDDFGVRCNTVYYNTFHKNDCLYLDESRKYVALSISIVTGRVFDDQPEADEHIGEIIITFDKPVARSEESVFFNDRGMDLTLDELCDQYPEFAKNLVFYLK